jgi:integrase
MRRLALIRLLEATGARRSEAVNLRVADVFQAKAMERPFLQLLTVKRRGRVSKRKVPVSHAELDFLIDFIELYRAPIIDRSLQGRDHGFVFINIKTGRQLAVGTVTLEIYLLRIGANIKGKAHPHLFRHRFFTMKVYRFIVANNVKDAKQFFELCMQFEKLKIEIMEETGVKSVGTLHRYVDWAFALMPLLKESPTAPTVDMQRLAREGRAEMAELQAERSVLEALEYADRVERSLKRFVDEMSVLSARQAEGPN